MVNIFALYADVALMCMAGVVPPDVILRLITSAVTAVLGLLGVVG